MRKESCAGASRKRFNRGENDRKKKKCQVSVTLNKYGLCRYVWFIPGAFQRNSYRLLIGFDFQRLPFEFSMKFVRVPLWVSLIAVSLFHAFYWYEKNKWVIWLLTCSTEGQTIRSLHKFRIFSLIKGWVVIRAFDWPVWINPSGGINFPAWLGGSHNDTDFKVDENNHPEFVLITEECIHPNRLLFLCLLLKNQGLC